MGKHKPVEFMAHPGKEETELRRSPRGTKLMFPVELISYIDLDYRLEPCKQPNPGCRCDALHLADLPTIF